MRSEARQAVLPINGETKRRSNWHRSHTAMSPTARGWPHESVLRTIRRFTFRPLQPWHLQTVSTAELGHTNIHESCAVWQPDRRKKYTHTHTNTGPHTCGSTHLCNARGGEKKKTSVKNPNLIKHTKQQRSHPCWFSTVSVIRTHLKRSSDSDRP